MRPLEGKEGQKRTYVHRATVYGEKQDQFGTNTTFTPVKCQIHVQTSFQGIFIDYWVNSSIAREKVKYTHTHITLGPRCQQLVFQK